MPDARTHRARAQRLLTDVLDEQVGGDLDVGALGRVGAGLHYIAFSADLRLDRAMNGVVVRVPKPDGPEALDHDLERAADLRRRLADHPGLSIEVPPPIGTASCQTGLGIVDARCGGYGLHEARVRSEHDPVETTARAAADIHALEMSELHHIVDGPEDRRADAEGALSTFGEHDHPALEEAGDWASDHLPPADAATLLHGDLQGRNLLVPSGLDSDGGGLGSGRTLSVLDWTAAQTGDPAYDLAIVTRGRRQIFARDGRTLDALVDAYNRRADRSIERSAVRFWELWLSANAFLDAVEQSGWTPRTEQRVADLDDLLRRCR